MQMGVSYATMSHFLAGTTMMVTTAFAGLICWVHFVIGVGVASSRTEYAPQRRGTDRAGRTEELHHLG